MRFTVTIVAIVDADSEERALELVHEYLNQPELEEESVNVDSVEEE